LTLRGNERDPAKAGVSAGGKLALTFVQGVPECRKDAWWGGATLRVGAERAKTEIVN